MVVTKPCCQSTNAIKACGSKDKSAQLIFLNLTFNNIHKLFQYSELSLSQQKHKLLILLLKK